MAFNVGSSPLLQSVSSSDRYGYEGLPPELAAEEQAQSAAQQIAQQPVVSGGENSAELVEKQQKYEKLVFVQIDFRLDADFIVDDALVSKISRNFYNLVADDA